MDVARRLNVVKKTSAATIRAELVRLRARKTKLSSAIRALGAYANISVGQRRIGCTRVLQAVGRGDNLGAAA